MQTKEIQINPKIDVRLFKTIKCKKKNKNKKKYIYIYIIICFDEMVNIILSFEDDTTDEFSFSVNVRQMLLL